MTYICIGYVNIYFSMVKKSLTGSVQYTAAIQRFNYVYTPSMSLAVLLS